MAEASPDPIVAVLRAWQQRESEVTVRDRYGNSFYGQVTLLDDDLVRIRPLPYTSGVASTKAYTLRVADVAYVQDE